MNDATGLILGVLSLAVLAYVMYWVVRNAVRAGLRDALDGASVSADGRLDLPDPGRRPTGGSGGR